MEIKNMSSNEIKPDVAIHLTPSIRMEPSGDIFYKDKLIDNDKEEVEGVRKWLNAMNDIIQKEKLLELKIESTKKPIFTSCNELLHFICKTKYK